MGWGTFTLVVEKAVEPREALSEFTGDSGRMEYRQLWANEHVAVYEMASDCAFAPYCSACGASLCAGCGEQPIVAVLAGMPMAVCPPGLTVPCPKKS